MSNYFLLPEYDSNDNIFSISPNCGCSSCCKYCYIELKNFIKPKKNECSVHETIQYIQSHPQYSSGSVFWVGTWGEIFPRNIELRNNGFLWVKLLLELGNPVIIITKASISSDELISLASWQKYSGQLFISESISTFNLWKEIEPYADPPETRIETLELALQNNIKCGAFISPFLKGITDVELPQILKRIGDSGIHTIAIQALHMNDFLEEKMNNDIRLSNIIDKFRNREKTNWQEMKTDRYTVVADDLLEYKKRILELSKENNISVCFHFKCMMAKLLGIKTNEISNIPALCQNCGFCKTM